QPVNLDNITNKLSNSWFQPLIQSLDCKWTGYAASLSKTIGEFLISSIRSVTQNSLHFFFMLFLTFYTLYYFLKDGEKMLHRLMHLSPLGDEYETMLYDRFTSTARSTLKGSLIIGGIQGLIGAILFWLTDVPGAVVWGVVMMAASLIPALGSFIIWLPVGIAMLIFGNFWQGITIIITGTFVISLVDNILRPHLVGKATQMHPLTILFSTLGGIFLFGISGFIIGPIIAALYLAAMTMYNHYYRNELENN
ncbi:MAG: AI-2E family transporter, partial [Patescibacteria group bacterium]